MRSPNLDKGWHVLYVKSRHEKKVHDLLKKEELESYLPLVKTMRKWKDRKKIIYDPLFHSYVFVKVNNKIDFHKALSIEGACSYIRFGLEYARVREEEINKIRILLNDENITGIEVNSQLLKVGELRKIDHGPLCGLECEILKIDKQEKVIVSINSIRQNIIANLPASYLLHLSSAIEYCL